MFHKLKLKIKAPLTVIAFIIISHLPTWTPSATPLERFRMRMTNIQNGPIEISINQGRSWHPIGTILTPNTGFIHHVKDGEFTAAKWASPSSVAATAVNALHIKLTHTGSHGELLSILPKDVMSWRESGMSYARESSSIYVDIPAGTSMFGMDWSFRVGDPLYLKEDTQWVEWPKNRLPKLGDEWMILALENGWPDWIIEIENTPSGSITLYAAGELPRVIAQVVKPVSGSGRFPGSVYQSTGRIRANHPGVIDISTSPFGSIGGLQIVPIEHGLSPQLRFTMISPVYMVIRPLDGMPKLEGSFPLFKGLIQPGDIAEARLNGEWTEFPESIGKDYSKLTLIEAIRIRPGPYSHHP